MPPALLTVPDRVGFRIPVFLVAREAFDGDAFERHGIAVPPGIRRSVPKRQTEFLCGRLAARQALEPFGLQDVAIGIGDRRQPIWPPGIRGSITHNDRVAAATALERERCNGIGIDLESVVSVDGQADLLDIAVSPAEIEYIAGLQDVLPLRVLLTLVFSGKESFYKAASETVGRFFGFDALVLTEINVDNCEMVFRIAQTLAPALPAGDICRIHFRWIDSETVLTSHVW